MQQLTKLLAAMISGFVLGVLTFVAVMLVTGTDPVDAGAGLLYTAVTLTAAASAIGSMLAWHMDIDVFSGPL